MTLNQAFWRWAMGRKYQVNLKKVLVSLTGIVANQDINPGQKLKINMFDYKRPGNVINSKELHKIVGMIDKRKITKNTLIKLNQLSK